MAGARLWACRTLLASALAGCAAAHPVAVLCDLAAGNADCPSGQVCRPTLTAEGDGPSYCMRVCEYSPDCGDGSVCVPRRPGPEWTCWPGGPVGYRGYCTHPVECAFGLYCTRDGECQVGCEGDADCGIPGFRCERGVCKRPVPPGSPCAYSSDCSPPYQSCRFETLFTCQANCSSSLCPDGRACTDDLECLDREPELVDQCGADVEGSGCQLRSTCILNPIGARRCMSTCEPTDEERCTLGLCLPDLEEGSELHACSLGGPVPIGGACGTHYDCAFGGCRNGLCVPRCTEGLRPCAETTRGLDGTFSCRDGLCEREAG